MTNQPNQFLLEQIIKEWNSAERAIKLTQMNSREIALPAITELRFAGRRIVDFLSLELKDGEENYESRVMLRDALADVISAKHDAVDVMIDKAGLNLLAAAENHGFEAFPDIQKDLQVITNAKLKIAESRTDRLSRNKIYDSLMDEDVSRIFEIAEKYSYVTPLTPARFDRIFPKKFPFNSSVFVFVLGAILSAIIGLLLALFAI